MVLLTSNFWCSNVLENMVVFTLLTKEENKGCLVHLKNPNIYSLNLQLDQAHSVDSLINQKTLLLTMICH